MLSETKDATREVVPVFLCAVIAALMDSGEAAEKYCPPPPWQWISINPGIKTPLTT